MICAILGISGCVLWRRFLQLGLSDAFYLCNFTKCLQVHHTFILSVLPRLPRSPSKASFISVTWLLISLSYVYFIGGGGGWLLFLCVPLESLTYKSYLSKILCLVAPITVSYLCLIVKIDSSIQCFFLRLVCLVTVGWKLNILYQIIDTEDLFLMLREEHYFLLLGL